MAHDRSPGELLRATLGRGRARDRAARRPGADPARPDRRPDRPRLRQRRRRGLHRRLRARRRVLRDPAARAGQDGRRDRHRRASHPDPAGRRPAGARRRRSRPSESGTRHRTAERVAKQTGFPVISVSQSMRIIALYVGGLRYVLEGSDAILAKANQALATLERYKSRLDEVTGTLSALEIEDLVTVRDVVDRRPAPGDGPPHLRGDRALRRRAGHRRPAALAAARRADRRRRAPTASWSSATTSRRPRRERSMSRTCSTTSPASPPTELRRPHPGRPRARLQHRRRRARRRGQPQGLPAAQQGPAAARRDRRPAGRPLRRPAEAARGQPRRPHDGRGRRRAAAPAPSARACPGSPSRASWSATSDRRPRRRPLPTAACTRRSSAGTPRTPATCPGAAPAATPWGVLSARSCSSRRRSPGSCPPGSAG